MKTVAFADLRARIADKKREIGWSDAPEVIERLRNKGNARTPARRRRLSRAEDRALCRSRAGSVLRLIFMSAADGVGDSGHCP